MRVLRDYLLAAKRQAGDGGAVHERGFARARQSAKSIKVRQPALPINPETHDHVFLTVGAGCGITGGDPVGATSGEPRTRELESGGYEFMPLDGARPVYICVLGLV